MRIVDHRLLKVAVPWATGLLLLLLLTACGGGDGNGDSPTEAGTTAAFGEVEKPQDETGEGKPEDDTQPGGFANSSPSTIEDLSPDDILKLMPAVGADNVLYLDVQEAIDALANHGEVRGRLKDRWEGTVIFGGFGINIADLDNIAFGDFNNGDDNLFLLGGVATGDLRDTLEEWNFLRDEIYGHELWLEEGTRFGWAVVIQGETVLFADEGEEMVADVLARFTGDLEVAAEALSLHDVAGDLWQGLPPGILKQMDVDDDCHAPNCERFGHSITKENDQQFRLTGISEFTSVEEAQEEWEGLEADDVHYACEATFDIDGKLIKYDALCDAEALLDLVDVS